MIQMKNQTSTIGEHLRMIFNMNIKNIVAGTILSIFGFVFVALSAQYKIGNPGSIGPGFIPLVISIFLSGCGVILVIRGVLNDR
jgi:hypothetical protein